MYFRFNKDVKVNSRNHDNKKIKECGLIRKIKIKIVGKRKKHFQNSLRFLHI